MVSNTVIQSILGVLKRYEPFSFLTDRALEKLAKGIQLMHFEPKETIFRQSQPSGEHFYMVVRGAVALWHESGGDRALIDVCGEGDIFGARAILAKGNYMASAIAQEESLLYAIGAASVQQLLEAHPKVAAFFAANFAATMPGRAQKIAQKQGESAGLDSHFDNRKVAHHTNVVTGAPELSVREAAALMSDHNIGSIVVTSGAKLPLGIVTDADLRRKVVSKGLDPQKLTLAQIMSSPVVTCNSSPTVSDLIMLMMRRNIRHFCITEDGSPQTPLVGIISERDVVATRGSNPAVLFRQIMLSSSSAQLTQLRDQLDPLLVAYLEQGVKMTFIARIVAEINDALIKKAVEFALKRLAEVGKHPPLPFCWLALGSEGRKEQLLRTDQDNALIYADGGQGEAKGFFLELGKQVTDILVACGFARCPGGIMGSNPKWCLSLSDWRSQFAQWVAQPDPKSLMHANIFFDLRAVAGDHQLADALRKSIHQQIKGRTQFKAHFAYSAMLNPPPLSFFRNLILEGEGKHSDRFDVKARAMMPLCDAARVLAYDAELAEQNTAQRFRELAKQDVKQAQLFHDAAHAYEKLLRLRVREGLRNQDSGRYIKAERLSKMQRQELKNIFKLIGELQQMLRVRYQTDYLG